MKKILLSLSVFVTATSFAQRITYGASAGVAVYNMRGDVVNNLQQVLGLSKDIVRAKSVTGFYAGGYTNIPVGGNLSVEPGLYYTGKGYEVNGSYSVKDIGLLTAAAGAKLNTSYIEMPLLLKAEFNGLQLFAGPQVGYLANAKLHTNVSVAGISVLSSNSDISNQFNRWDVGITGGAGYRFSNGMGIKASYERGLSRVDAGKNIRSYNQGFKIGAFFSF